MKRLVLIIAGLSALSIVFWAGAACGFVAANRWRQADIASMREQRDTWADMAAIYERDLRATESKCYGASK